MEQSQRPPEQSASVLLPRQGDTTAEPTDIRYPPQAEKASEPEPTQATHNQKTTAPQRSDAKEAKSSGQPPARQTIAGYVAEHPDRSVKHAMHKVFPKANPLNRLAHRFQVKHSVIEGLTDEEMAHWEAKGPELRRLAGWKLPGEDGPGAEVSPLFWKMYLSLMPTLNRDPLSGMAAPDLLGSTTTMPLSIISLIPDIMKHYAGVIVRAQTEVFLATNYWQPSDSVTAVSNALRELSARVIKEGRSKIVVKIMYDRGSWEQLWNAHAAVKPVDWVKLDLPDPADVPGLDLEVINFHKVLLGTFHVKFLIIDRKVVLINSCNIQDRPNLEMMTHLEGPVVDSFYDIALHAWHNKLSPMLPCISDNYVPPKDAYGNIQYRFRDHNPYFQDLEVLKAARAARRLLRRQTEDLHSDRARMMEDGYHPTRDRLVEAVRTVVANQRQSFAHTQGEIAQRSATAMKEIRGFGERMGMNLAFSRPNSRPPSRHQSAADLSRLAEDHDDETSAFTAQNARTDNMPPLSEARTSPTLNEYPMKSKTAPAAAVDHHPRFIIQDDDDALTAPTTVQSSRRTSFHSALEDMSESHHDHHLPHIQVDNLGTGQFLDAPMAESPGAVSPADQPRPSVEFARDLNEKSHNKGSQSPFDNPPHDDGEGHYHSRASIGDYRYPDDMASGQQTPHLPKPSMDEEIPPGRGTKRMFKLSKRFNAGALSEAWATVEDSDELDNFKPHVIHAPHDPFPIAMVCRRAHGMPGHHDIRNPQNAAWLAGCRYAKRKVFIQTPTFNARPLVRAVKQACRRGVEVTLFVDLGFNDMAESIMFQGGTNEQVVDRLYKKLGKEGKAKHLKVYWYTGKDQIRPLNAITKQRNCHIKFAAYDDEVMILGNANGDTQSVFHSAEVNIMLDSKQTTAEMMETLLQNQNTMQYGGVSGDGVWRDAEGKTLKDYGLAGGGGFMQGFQAFVRFAKTAAK